MPILEYKGEVICESMAIAKFLAELCNLAGTTTLNKAKADEIVLAVNGIFESVAKCLFAPEVPRKDPLRNQLQNLISGSLLFSSHPTMQVPFAFPYSKLLLSWVVQLGFVPALDYCL